MLLTSPTHYQDGDITGGTTLRHFPVLGLAIDNHAACSASKGPGEISFLRRVSRIKLENHDSFAVTLARSVFVLLPSTATVSKTVIRKTLF